MKHHHHHYRRQSDVVKMNLAAQYTYVNVYGAVAAVRGCDESTATCDSYRGEGRHVRYLFPNTGALLCRAFFVLRAFLNLEK